MRHPADLPQVYRCLQDNVLQSAMADLGQKVRKIYGPCLWEKLEGVGRGSEDSTGFQQGASSCASVASGTGESRGQVFSH